MKLKAMAAIGIAVVCMLGGACATKKYVRNPRKRTRHTN